MHRFVEINIRRLYLCLPWLALLTVLYPYSQSGFFFDDIFNSLTSGSLVYSGKTVWVLVMEQLLLWASNGRFYPLSVIIGSPLWEVCDTLFKYRFVHLFFVFANAVQMYILLLNICRSHVYPSLVIYCISLVFQFNARWDPITSFGPLNQLVLFFVLSAWIFLQYYYVTGKKYFLLFTSIAQIMALCTYEVAIVVIPGLMVLSWFYKDGRPQAFRISAFLFIPITVAYFFIYAYFFMTKTVHYEGTTVGFSKVITTFIAQVASAFPHAFWKNKILSSSFEISFFLCFFAIFLIIGWKIFQYVSKEKFTQFNYLPNRYFLIFLIGLSLIITPSLLVAISERYQNIVTYGDPYIVVYVSYWGAAILLALFLQKLLRLISGKHTFFIILLLLVSMSAALTVSVNLSRIHKKNVDFLEPRASMERIIHSGLLSGISSNDILVVESTYPWEAGYGDTCSYFFSLWAQKPINCIPVTRYINESINLLHDSDSVYILRRKNSSKIEPYIELVGKGQKVIAKDTINGVIFESINTNNIDRIVGPVLGGGFYGWEPAGAKVWAWSSGNADLIFYNISDSSRLIKIHTKLVSPINRKVEWTANVENPVEFLLFAEQPLEVEFKFYMPPGRASIKLSPSDSSLRLSLSDDRLFSFRIENLYIE
jgi:hypothetical protein